MLIKLPQNTMGRDKMDRSPFSNPPDDIQDRIKEIRSSSRFIVRNLIKEGRAYTGHSHKILVPVETLCYLHGEIVRLEEEIECLRK